MLDMALVYFSRTKQYANFRHTLPFSKNKRTERQLRENELEANSGQATYVVLPVMVLHLSVANKMPKH